MNPLKVWLYLLVIPFFGSIFGQTEFRALTLSGVVVIEDGRPLPDRATIEMVCSGRVQPQGRTNLEGAVSFRVGGDQAFAISASDATSPNPSSPVGARGQDRSHVNLMNCELRASLEGFQSSSINLGRRSVFENPDIGEIVLYPLDGPAGTLVSSTAGTAPKKARKAYEAAQEELSKDNPNLERASKELEAAVKEYPGFADAWNLLGETQARLGNLSDAHSSFSSSLEADPALTPPALSLALLALQQGQTDEVIKITDKLIGLAPDSAEAHYYRGLAHAALGSLRAAGEDLTFVIESQDLERFPRALYVLGDIYVQAEMIGPAAENFRRYLELEPDSRAAAAARQQLEEWEAQGKLE